MSLGEFQRDNPAIPLTSTPLLFPAFGMGPLTIFRGVGEDQSVFGIPRLGTQV